ncbi:helix-turn-helix domain-containing protein [Ruminococcus flavefaciens]|uniref:helix-turn-helix domain-containing protein n=1 Tax=Ruminococcus flavefaciens TaxID=1265 RepID=UPI0026EFE925|nr:helix-turn-helix transcriptional regulator [Ruminococcus flavefaciens]
MPLGETIKKVRLFKKISQKELAKRIGIAPNTLYRYEHGDISLSLEMLNKLAEALNVSIDTLLVEPECIPDRNIIFDNKPITEPDMKQSIEGAQKLVSQLDDFSKELQKSYDKLNNDGKQAVNVYAEYLSTQEKYKK